MFQLPHSLHTAEQIRTLESRAFASGLSDYALMTRAGQAAFQFLRERWPSARRIVVLAGPGNNGGDGHVLARRIAWTQQLDVKVLTVGNADDRKGAAVEAASEAMGARIDRLPWSGELPPADLYVDAIFGAGLNRAPTGEHAQAIQALNQSGKPVLALDLPSGLHADTGAELGEAVRADVTLTFVALKAGLLTGRGPALTGELVFAGLDLPVFVYRDLPSVAERMEPADLAVLGRRPRDAHKGSNGHVLVVGGDHGMAGAAMLAAEAALRSGAGRVSVATRPTHHVAMTAARPELMCHGVADAAGLAPLLARADVVVLGPGLGQDDWGASLFAAALAASLPLVVDADGLNFLAQQPVHRSDWLLTPHPGEAARLLGCSVDEVQNDRFAALNALREKFGGRIVLKGAGTLVADEGGVALCPYGNPGMAVAGMGDVLSGVAGALCAQGMKSPARLAVLAHALAGDAAAADGERGMMATDLLPHLRRCVNP